MLNTQKCILGGVVMKGLNIVIISIITIFLSGCSSSFYEERVLSDEQWIEDIECLDYNLREYHTEVFKFIEEDEWEKNIEELKSDVKELSDSDIKLRIAQIISSVGDAHTNILPSELLSPVPSPILKGENPTDIGGVLDFPIKCDFFDDGLRVVECDSKYKEILGYKLISINNIDVDIILNKISSLIGYDYGNNQKGLGYANELMNSFEILKFFNIVDNNKAKYIFENNNEQKQLSYEMQSKIMKIISMV